MFLASYLTALQGGLAAALLVGGLLGLLTRTGRDRLVLPAWAAVAAGSIVVATLGGVLAYGVPDLLTYQQRALIGAIASLLAAALITAAIRGPASRPEWAEVAVAVALAFLAVVREGLETAVIGYAALQGAPASAVPALGLFAGLATAAGLGWGLHEALHRARQNLPPHRAFTTAGVVLLVLFTAGILAGAVHDLQEAQALPGLSLSVDLSAWIDPAGWPAALLGGVFNVAVEPTLAESVAWIAYVAGMLVPGRVWLALLRRQRFVLTTPGSQ